MPKPIQWRDRTMQSAKRVVLFYLAVIALFTWFQRSMMYPAGRAETLPVAEFPITTGKFAKAADVELVSGGDEKIRGWLLQTDKNRGDRLVLFFHGNGSHRGRRLSWYELFWSINVDVLAMDYRGYADSEGQPSEKALTEDAVAIWKYATQKLGYRPDQIVIAGESLGGGVGVKLASTVCQQGEQPAGLILVSTFSSMLDTARNRFWWLPVRFLLIDRYRSDLEMPHVTCPVLQFHGTADSIVPLRLGQRLQEVTPAKSKNGVAKKLVLFRGTGHNNVMDRNGKELQEEIHQWIQAGRTSVKQ
ncbi:MAG: alpha/beta hydrolase [Fuerstia sp.]|nr:alpha/beta hydrolase [Fuerstiella sp.]